MLEGSLEIRGSAFIIRRGGALCGGYQEDFGYLGEEVRVTPRVGEWILGMWMCGARFRVGNRCDGVETPRFHGGCCD